MTAPERMPDKLLIKLVDNPNSVCDGMYINAAGGNEYTRTDIHQAALDRIAELEGELEDIAGMGHDMPMTLELTDEQWARRRAGIMQRIARDVLAKGDG